MDWETQFDRVGVLAVRLVVVVAALIGVYLLLEGASVLHRLFGIVLAGAGLFLLYHHSVVYFRGSMEE